MLEKEGDKERKLQREKRGKEKRRGDRSQESKRNEERQLRGSWLEMKKGQKCRVISGERDSAERYTDGERWILRGAEGR